MERRVNDELVLHSSNGMDYKIVIVSINYYREPDSIYAIDMWDGNGTYAGDVLFVGDDFLNKCEYVRNTEED